jgi:hypothetical protein
MSIYVDNVLLKFSEKQQNSSCDYYGVLNSVSRKVVKYWFLFNRKNTATLKRKNPARRSGALGNK